MKFRFAITLVAGLAAAACLFVCAEPSAQAGTIGVIIHRSAQVRTGPSRNTALVANIYRGKRLNVDGSQNGWDHFTNPDLQGWVRANSVSFGASTSAVTVIGPGAVIIR